jgi:hypothetical protein
LEVAATAAGVVGGWRVGVAAALEFLQAYKEERPAEGVMGGESGGRRREVRAEERPGRAVENAA